MSQLANALEDAISREVAASAASNRPASSKSNNNRTASLASNRPASKASQLSASPAQAQAQAATLSSSSTPASRRDYLINNGVHATIIFNNGYRPGSKGSSTSIVLNASRSKSASSLSQRKPQNQLTISQRSNASQPGGNYFHILIRC